MAGHSGHGLFLLARYLSSLRDGSFLTRERAGLWAFAMLIGFAAGIAALFLSAHNNLDYSGRPIGTDFSNVYTAGVAVLHGQPELPFDPEKQYHAEQAIFGHATPFYGWHYPPYFLLIAAPLATMPYLPALIVWQLATMALYLGALLLLLRGGPAPQLADEKMWPALALGFTAVFVNLTHGHNGFLTAALFGGALALLEKRPIVAGILFGLLAYKPQFAIVLPLALAAAGQWRAIASATATVALLSIAVTLLFGVGVWSAFLESMHFTRTVVLEQGGTGFHKIQSVFAWVRLWHGSVSLAYALQMMTTLGVALSLALVWRSEASLAIKGALLCFAAILATPYSLDYDLMILAPAIALLVADGVANGFAPWRLTLLTALWLTPIADRQIALALIPLGPALLLGAYISLCWSALSAGQHGTFRSGAIAH
jgi:hypothetical protein